MHPLLRLILIALVVLLIIAIVASLLLGFDPPTQPVEQIIPNDRFTQ